MGAGQAFKQAIPKKTKELNAQEVEAIFGEYYDASIFLLHARAVKGAEEPTIERHTLERILDESADSTLDASFKSKKEVPKVIAKVCNVGDPLQS